jgi:hypothetical protein
MRVTYASSASHRYKLCELLGREARGNENGRSNQLRPSGGYVTRAVRVE